MSVEDIRLMNGQRRWRSSMTVPIERVKDTQFIEHIKIQLKETCVKKYIDSIDDSFEYDISTNKISRVAEIKITMEDLFGLKKQNKKLNRELSELVGRYRALLNERNR